MNLPVRPIALVCHPDTPADPVRGIVVRASARADGGLGLRYLVDADTARLRIPARIAPYRADRLWAHTCLEAFVAHRTPPAATENEVYREFNFSPSGQWASYAFRAYRERIDAAPGESMSTDQPPALIENPSPPPDLPGSISSRLVSLSAAGFALEATIPAAMLPARSGGAAMAMGLAAVIERRDGELSYWAIRHPTGRPDFHHRDGFALEFGWPQPIRHMLGACK